MVVVEAAAGRPVVVVVGMADVDVPVDVVGMVVNAIEAVIAKTTISCISFLTLSLSSNGGHCQSSPLFNIKYTTVQLILNDKSSLYIATCGISLINFVCKYCRLAK